MKKPQVGNRKMRHVEVKLDFTEEEWSIVRLLRLRARIISFKEFFEYCCYQVVDCEKPTSALELKLRAKEARCRLPVFKSAFLSRN